MLLKNKIKQKQKPSVYMEKFFEFLPFVSGFVVFLYIYICPPESFQAVKMNLFIRKYLKFLIVVGNIHAF